MSDDITQTPIGIVDYLLSHLAQECCEVAICCTKAQHFGLDEIEPSQELTNRQRIVGEFADVLAVAEVLRQKKILPELTDIEIGDRIEAKRRKMLKFRDYSRELGRLDQ